MAPGTSTSTRSRTASEWARPVLVFEPEISAIDPGHAVQELHPLQPIDTNYYYNATPGAAQRDIKSALRYMRFCVISPPCNSRTNAQEFYAAYREALTKVQNDLGSQGLRARGQHGYRSRRLPSATMSSSAGPGTSLIGPAAASPHGSSCMPNFDGGHYFLTALIPIKSAEYLEQDGRKNSPVHMVRNALAVLPRRAVAGHRTDRFNSPFARNTRTHFARLFVIDDVINNGRNPVNALKVAIGSVLGQASAVRLNPTTQQPYDQLSQPYLVFVADFDCIQQ
jgi:hypothetical protein